MINGAARSVTFLHSTVSAQKKDLAAPFIILVQVKHALACLCVRLGDSSCQFVYVCVISNQVRIRVTCLFQQVGC